ncbi:hypothetical protein [Herbiconiux ginsengi]|uniref:Uncharacterized protein n=1 Tax=Herbiconiux ginsengi TaxID=381665 RepID=A0A1H3SAR1_9MICO|nr:hypothetical protein [Herbiconiux ginsengi]SDZ35173.1 hypothetical protein SAMN05216554_3461 [Herbiconiux ginsengi]
MQRRIDHRKGRFYRPELETGWQRLAGSWTFRILAGLVLLAAVTGLVVVAALRFA